MTFYGPLAFGYDPQDAPDGPEEPECGHGLCDTTVRGPFISYHCRDCKETFTMLHEAVEYGEGPGYGEEWTTLVGDDETACCHAPTTFHDITLCCRSCYREVT